MRQRTFTVIFALTFIVLSTNRPQVYAQTVDPVLQGRLLRLENFLTNQFDATVGLVRESPDDSIPRGYWLLSDNLIAMHILAQNHPDIAAKINRTMHKFGIFADGLHETLFGAVVPLPPYTPLVKVVQNGSFIIKVEVRSNELGKLQPDWVEYADILVYAALSAHNAGNDQLAIYNFNKALELWNGAGLWDRPTRQDGFYTTHKLALLMYAADKLNQAIPFRNTLEARIWQFQRDDSGIQSHYLGNLTSNREANGETAGLVLLAYQFKIHKDALEAETQAEIVAKQQAEARAQLIEQTILIAVVVFFVSVLALMIKRTRSHHNS